MKLVPMRFKGVGWRHNPREVVFEDKQRLAELTAPYDGSVVQNLGRRSMQVKGEGELFGADCLQQFDRLLALFRSGGSGVLTIAGFKPFYAVFESLEMVGKPRSDVLTYRFVFRETPRRDSETIHTADEGETLWDISYRFGVEIDTLVALNPQVKRPDLPLTGEEVRLC